MQRNTDGSGTSITLVVVALLIGVATCPASGQQATSESLLDEAKRTSDSVDKKRLLLKAIRQDSLNVEARVLLGAGYYEVTGNIEAAVEQFDTTMAIADSANIAFSDAQFYLEEIERYFKPLHIRISDRRVSALGYIEGVDIQLRYPRSLTSEQQRRLAYLQDEQQRGPNEFQLNRFDENGVPFFEIPFFPVVISFDSPTYLKYSLILNSERRYRFDFSANKRDSVFIHWNDQWKIVERVPTDLVKIQYPATYTFTPEGELFQLALVDSANNRRNLYVPADERVEVVLSASLESSRERTLSRLIKGLVAAAALIGLGGAR